MSNIENTDPFLDQLPEESPDKLSEEERNKLINAMKAMYADADLSMNEQIITADNNNQTASTGNSVGMTTTAGYLQSDYDDNTAPAITTTTAGNWGALYEESSEKIKENEKLLMDIDCVKDSETDEYHLILKVGLRIDKTDINFNKKSELSDALIKRIQKVRDNLDKLLKNKQSLIALLK